MFNKFILSPLRGSLAILLILINALIFPPIVIIFAGLFSLLPCKQWRLKARGWLAYIPFPWTSINSAALAIGTHGRWDIQLPPGIENNKPYLVICNHQTWIDILVLYKIFNWGIQPLKFFMKKQLLWSLPIIGLACKSIGFPFLERHTSQAVKKNPSLRGKDIATTRACCQRFLQIPSSMIIFTEGTRYTKQKASKQKSPYKHLLKPKAGGLSIVLGEMHHHLAGIIDVTIHYDMDNINTWNILKGDCKHIRVQAQLRPITDDLIGNYAEDRAFRVTLQQKLNTLWQQKDELIDKMEH